MGNKKGNSPFGERRKAIMVEQAKYLLFKRRLNQKETAKELRIHEKTMGRWIKELGWKEKLTATRGNEIKFTDSLIAFVLYVKKKHPDSYQALEPLYNEFINKH